MTNNEVIIDYTQCKYNTFDGGGSQRTICSLDGKYCDCLRDKECYYKQLQRKTQECEKLKEEAIYGYVGDLSNKLRAKVFKDLKEENQKYKSALDEIENKIISYCATTCIYGSSCYKECFILDIITKTKEQE